MPDPKQTQTTRAASIPFGGQNHDGGIAGDLARAQREIKRLTIENMRLKHDVSRLMDICVKEVS